MASQIISSLGTAVSACFDWLSTFFSSTGTTAIFITCFVILLVFRFLIRPLVGQSVSDGVRGIRGRDDSQLRRDSYNATIEARNAQRDYYNSRK